MSFVAVLQGVIGKTELVLPLRALLPAGTTARGIFPDNQIKIYSFVVANEK